MLKNLLNKKRQEGFTIVEVMIVLAIAGLIILVVFLAVPALQRNSRNTQRSNDASLVGAAINECLNSRNGVSTGCDADTAAELGNFLDKSKLRQLTDVGFSTTAPAASDITTINIAFSSKCNTEGSARVAAGARQVALLYNVEGSGSSVPRCQEI